MRHILVWAIGLGMIASLAQADPRATYNMYGVPGLLEMPTAQMAPDAELGATFSYAG
ncbi:MAG: YjbH domain-containing protein, partial [Planktomarina sp.]